MGEPSKAEKLAAAKRMLKEYQQKSKEQTSSSQAQKPTNNPTNGIPPFPNQPPPNQFTQNGHSQIKTPSHDSTTNSSNPSPVYTFHKENTPQNVETFFDNFPSPQLPPIPPENSQPQMFEQRPPEPVYNFYNPLDRTRDSDRTETSSSSSRSEDETHKRLINVETQLMVEASHKDELQKRLYDSNEKIKILENEIRRLSDENAKLSGQKSPLEDEVKLHLKTIQILVSEKSELQQELSAIQEENKTNKSKCEEFSVRTRALRSQVAKLEQEIGETAEARQQHNSILKKLEQNLSEARSLAEQYRKEVMDSKDEIRSLNWRINQFAEENEMLKKTIDDKNSQLSLAEMKIAQSGLGDAMPTIEDVDRIKALEAEIERLKGEVKTAMKEKAESNAQYQEYIGTLNSQLQAINEEKAVLIREKNEKIEREDFLIRQLSELEKQMTKERQAGPSLTVTNTQLAEKINDLESRLSTAESQLSQKVSECENLTSELTMTVQRLNEAEDALERLEVPDAKRLEEAMESDRIAASRAIEQNTLLKQQVSDLTTEMNETVVRLNNEKLDLTERLQHAEYVAKELTFRLQKYKNQEGITSYDAVSQTQVVFHMEASAQTDLDDLSLPTDYENATPESMRLLERKLMKTMNDLATLSDEKQKLEHLVTQLQSETETICEYVTLYQNQRGLLQEKAVERERQLTALAKEREELKMKLGQISNLLPKALPEDAHLHNGDDSPKEAEGAATKIKHLLTEIEYSSLVQDSIYTPTTFHPCLLCSGKLITV